MHICSSSLNRYTRLRKLRVPLVYTSADSCPCQPCVNACSVNENPVWQSVTVTRGGGSPTSAFGRVHCVRFGLRNGPAIQFDASRGKMSAWRTFRLVSTARERLITVIQPRLPWESPHFRKICTIVCTYTRSAGRLISASMFRSQLEIMEALDPT